MAFNKQFHVKGLVPAVFTPFTSEGELNLKLIPDYAAFLVAKGIKSVFVNGTTGEGPSMSVAERKLVAEAWMNNNKHGLEHVILHIGGANIQESKEMARHASDIGADAIGLMPPTFIKPETLESLVEYCKQTAACAPTLPFYYYNIPIMTGVRFNIVDYMRQMEAAVPTFRGIKYSNWDMTEASLCSNYGNGKYNILFGVDQQLLSALVFGIDAAIGSTYNFMAPIYHRLIQAKDNGDLETARKEQLKTQQMLDVAFKYGSGVPVLKAVMNMITPIDMGPPRLPLTSIAKDKVTQMKQELTQLGFFDWI